MLPLLLYDMHQVTHQKHVHITSGIECTVLLVSLHCYQTYLEELQSTEKSSDVEKTHNMHQGYIQEAIHNHQLPLTIPFHFVLK